jgi:VIT1/CCC1 family predicted Fe2+/Mn2+ transporter
MASNRIARFQRTYMSYGDWLGEWLSGFIIVAIITGLISGFSALGLDRFDSTVLLLFLAFAATTAWGLIDGFQSMYGGLVDEADQEELIGRLKKDGKNKELRGELIDSLDDSPAEYLTEEEKEKLVDQIISRAPDVKKRYHFNKDYWNTLIATASCDILAAIPVILPFLLLGFGPVPLAASRAIAALAIGYIAYLYSEHTGRRKYLAAGIFIILTVVVMSITYYIGW